LSTLYFHKYGPGCPLPRAIYLVATAKFMAEKTLGVGPNTVMFAMKRTGGWIPIMPDHLKTIRELWKDEGAPRLPKAAEGLVSELLKDKLREE